MEMLRVCASRPHARDLSASKDEEIDELFGQAGGGRLHTKPFSSVLGSSGEAVLRRSAEGSQPPPSLGCQWAGAGKSAGSGAPYCHWDNARVMLT